MFLVNRRRVCAVAATILAAFLIPFDAHADSNHGKRYNGEPFNGYWIGPRATSYKSDIRDAYDIWIQTCSQTGDLQLIRLAQRIVGTESAPNTSTNHTPGQDVITFPTIYETTFPRENLSLARTRMYKKNASGKGVLDDDAPLMSNRDRNWYYCAIEVDIKSIRAIAPDPSGLLRVVMVHEIGHSLKLAHPPEGPPLQPYVAGSPGHTPGEGTFRKDRTFGNDYSVMQRQNTSTTPSSYDKTEIKEKWKTP